MSATNQEDVIEAGTDLLICILLDAYNNNISLKQACKNHDAPYVECKKILEYIDTQCDFKY